ncbi:hypothetical protein ACFPJ1_43150 [Kribbella qitaiheensis]
MAIKLLLPVRESRAGVERFEREARAAAMLWMQLGDISVHAVK